MSASSAASITLFTPPHVPNHPSHLASLIPSQSLAHLPSFELESGEVLEDVWIGWKSWGKLNDERNNAMVVCHALTGSSDLEDWWGPLLGPGLAFDPTRYFIICCNVLGSPYGTSSPITVNPRTGKLYGPEFPSTTVRDDVRLHKLLLDRLGVESVAVVIGGSMGGMQALEWPLLTPEGYVQNVIPIATCARHSAWGISWGEAQRQSIYSDPKYQDGYYALDDGPSAGLAAARMAALLTYRSRDSFESRFGRREQESPRGSGEIDRTYSPALEAHNDGHKRFGASRVNHKSPMLGEGREEAVPLAAASQKTIFRAQSYLRYQGDKFISRFDANCYLHITRKMDSHDVSRGRPSAPNPLSRIPKGALVMAISSDGLFTMTEQEELANNIPEAKLVIIQSPDGHDGFLLEFEQINSHILSFLHSRLPSIYEGEPIMKVEGDGVEHSFQVKKPSLFGEAEGASDEEGERKGVGVEEVSSEPDVTRW
ncbi:homoserine O-acetyltransferase [Atractiella rhizophila]|nr:homoserine O-acetyltransferase [Atractiella rhizophila]